MKNAFTIDARLGFRSPLSHLTSKNTQYPSPLLPPITFHLYCCRVCIVIGNLLLLNFQRKYPFQSILSPKSDLKKRMSKKRMLNVLFFTKSNEYDIEILLRFFQMSLSVAVPQWELHIVSCEVHDWAAS